MKTGIHCHAVVLVGCASSAGDSRMPVDSDSDGWEAAGDFVRLASYRSVSVNDTMVCAMDSGGEVTCWGLAATVEHCQQPDFKVPVRAAIISGRDVCGLGPDGVVCGAGTKSGTMLAGEFVDFAIYGALGTKMCGVGPDGIACTDTPVDCGADPSPSAPLSAIVGGLFPSAETDRFCTLDSAGYGFCWGTDCREDELEGCTCDKGPFGPTSLGGPNLDIAMDACVLRVDGSIVCPDYYVIEPPSGVFTSLARTPYPFPLAIDDSGRIVKWEGGPDAAQPKRTFVNVQPTILQTGDSSKEMTCAIDSDGSVLCWGIGIGDLVPCD